MILVNSCWRAESGLGLCSFSMYERFFARLCLLILLSRWEVVRWRRLFFSWAEAWCSCAEAFELVAAFPELEIMLCNERTRSCESVSIYWKSSHSFNFYRFALPRLNVTNSFNSLVFE